MNLSSDKLALDGGTPAAANLQFPAWPPVSDDAERDLVEIYRSRNWSFGGAHELAFAQEFADAHDADFGVFMVNGTVTLQCALALHGVGPGDEVIIPALTWPATAMAVIYLGATPVFVDVRPDTICLDEAAVEAAITPRTRAIIPVHLYGSMADLDAMKAIAERHDLALIEDCAHAHGGKWNGKGLGSIGAVGSFSFQQSKTMAAGEGGICLTSDESFAEKLYRMKHIGYGPAVRQGAAASGPPEGMPVYNFRATEFQAAILRHQLRELDALIDRYNANAARLEAMLQDVPGVRVQSRGRCSTRQSYYCLLFLFDEEPMKDIPLSLIQQALSAEGLTMLWPTYGVVYKHLLWNVPSANYRIAGDCRVAEDVGMAHGIAMVHYFLGMSEADIDALGNAIIKVARNADALRARTASSVE